MNNYQLYRTNVKLGGQIKLNLVLDAPDTTAINMSDINDMDYLNITDYNISPIQDNSYMNYDNDFINNSHHTNIQKIYSGNKKQFYEDVQFGQKYSPYPLIKNKQFTSSHVNDFEMGCRRVEYSTYNKQFEFFCPIWLEHLNEGDYIQFELSSGIDNTKYISKKLISFDINKFSGAVHTKFVNYFNEYLKYTNILGEGNDNILNLDIANNLSILSGLSLKTGNMSSIKLPSLMHEIVDTEMPLIDFNNLIINQLKDNDIIVPQLFNFSFYFNPEDVFMKVILDRLYGKRINFNMTVKIFNSKTSQFEVLDTVDFYSNFEYIPKKYIGPINPAFDTSNAPNVLDYLQDYKYIDIIDKNKMVQNVIHWSLTDNNDYIFNIYDGFAGYSFDEDGNKILHSHMYDDTPDVTTLFYDVMVNSIGWCNYINLGDFVNKYSINGHYFLNAIDYFADNASDFSSDVTWVNKIKYDVDPEKYQVKLMLITNNSFVDMGDLLTSRGYNYIKFGKSLNSRGGLVFKHSKSNTLFISFDFKNIGGAPDDKIRHITSFFNLKSCLQSIESGDEKILDLVHKLLRKMDTIQNSSNPSIVTIYKTLEPEVCDGPKKNIGEITYKRANTNTYVLRQFGKIKPTFLKDQSDINFNYLYYKDVMSQDDFCKSIYSTYINSPHKPLYPSIGYFPYKKIVQKYSIEEQAKTCNTDVLDTLRNMYEYRWFNVSNYLIMHPQVTINFMTKDVFGDNQFHAMSETEKKYGIKEHIKNELSELYNIYDNGLLNYMYELYDVESQYDYESETDINNYKYNIKLTLK